MVPSLPTAEHVTVGYASSELGGCVQDLISWHAGPAWSYPNMPAANLTAMLNAVRLKPEGCQKGGFDRQLYRLLMLNTDCRSYVHFDMT